MVKIQIPSICNLRFNVSRDLLAQNNTANKPVSVVKSNNEYVVKSHMLSCRLIVLINSKKQEVSFDCYCS